MATLEDLINGGYANMIRTPEQLAARKQEVINATLPQYLRQYGDKTQAALESAFGRGMGLSTWNAQQMALQQLMEREGAANIENQAQTAVDEAQRAAVGQAASYSTANANRAAQERISAGNQTVARQLQKMRGNQAIQGELVKGATGIGAGVGGMAGRSLFARPGSGNTPTEAWQNLKANLNDLLPSQAAPEIGSATGASEMASNRGAYNAPSTGFSWDNAPPETSFPGISYGASGSDAGDMLGAYSYGGPGLDLQSLLASTFMPDYSSVAF